MTLVILQQYWALIVASVLGVAIGLFVLHRLYASSAHGQLLRVVQAHAMSQQAAGKARRRVRGTRSRLEKLYAKEASTKPRVLQEGIDALADAKALLKIAEDQAMISANHVRKIILEEFPPKRHAKLRARYLPESEPDKKPFTF